MALSDLFKPKWKHSNKDIRKKAIQILYDESILKEIALSDNNHEVRILATLKINNQNSLLEIYKNDNDSLVRQEVVKKIVDEKILKDIVLSDKDLDVALTAFKKIKNQKYLGTIAKKVEALEIRKQTIQYIYDESILKEIALSDSNHEVRILATLKINNQDSLLEIYKNDNDYLVRDEVVKKVIDEKILKDIVLSEEDTDVALTAIKKISNQELLVNILNIINNDSIRLEIIKGLENDSNLVQQVLIDIAKNSEAVSIRNSAKKLITNQSVLKEIEKEQSPKKRISKIKSVYEYKESWFNREILGTFEFDSNGNLITTVAIFRNGIKSKTDTKIFTYKTENRKAIIISPNGNEQVYNIKGKQLVGTERTLNLIKGESLSVLTKSDGTEKEISKKEGELIIYREENARSMAKEIDFFVKPKSDLVAFELNKPTSEKLVIEINTTCHDCSNPLKNKINIFIGAIGGPTIKCPNCGSDIEIYYDTITKGNRKVLFIGSSPLTYTNFFRIPQIGKIEVIHPKEK